jgi:hypothetical protein
LPAQPATCTSGPRIHPDSLAALLTEVLDGIELVRIDLRGGADCELSAADRHASAPDRDAAEGDGSDAPPDRDQAAIERELITPSDPGELVVPRPAEPSLADRTARAVVETHTRVTDRRAYLAGSLAPGGR